MSPAQEVPIIGGEQQLPPAVHQMRIGPDRAFDARGVVQNVWALACSCGHTDAAIDQRGIDRAARLHTVELQIAALTMQLTMLDGFLGAVINAAGITQEQIQQAFERKRAEAAAALEAVVEQVAAGVEQEVQDDADRALDELADEHERDAADEADRVQDELAAEADA